MKIEHGPNPIDFRYHASANGKPIDNPRLLKLDRGEFITFESPHELTLRFRESPFENPATVLDAIQSGSVWTISARVRSNAVYHRHYHYTVIDGTSADDPEIIIET
jgi:hypothetical protein